ncbi:hypothetical protein [Rhizohabitans arisaemae]|uniref:nSTAND1 domain-containing NTPase n=1 Tax=Rhizohabitans arisaemae TaxID=2720610 RepID=UPI0024B04980|nr:hypothetical protein [Rhizohabitans arisaemae]
MGAERRAGRPEGSIDPDAGPAERFAWELRLLREEAGAPGYRALARRAHYSASTLAEAARGRRLPTLEVTLAYAEACGGDRQEWTARWQAAASLVNATTAPHADEGCPYPGLAAFRARDADWFFGRSDLVTRLSRRLRADGPQGLTALFGASGSGKSSLIQAGLLPALPREWCPVVFTPGAHPLAELADALAVRTGDDPGALAARVAEDPSSVGPLIGTWLADRPERTHLLLVVDQFEETFTLCSDTGERDVFLRAVREAARAPLDRLRVVLAVRADFYAHCSGDPHLVAALTEGTQVPIGPLSQDGLREIITAPAAKAGLDVEADLVTVLCAEAGGEPGALPLLSHALRETWRRRTGPVLRLGDYRAGGGLRGSIAQTAETIYLAGDAVRRRAIRTVFLRLTALGEGTKDTRRRVGHAELTGVTGAGDLLETLARARLVVLDRDTVEVAHEALISAWPRLRHWLADSRDDLRTHRRLTQAALTWAELGRDRGTLLRGGYLAALRDWAARRREDLNTLEEEFLAACSGAERRRSRLARYLVAAMAVLLALAVAAAVTAVNAQDVAHDQRDTALAEKAAGEAAALREADPALAAQLGLAAYGLAPTVATRSSLLSAFAAPFATKIAHHINTVAFAPDGRVMAAGGDDRTIRLWDMSAPHRPVLLADLPGQPDAVESIGLIDGGRTMISAAYDGSVRFWDLSEPRRPVLRSGFAAHDAAVYHALPGPDGRTLFTAGGDGTVRVWDLSRPSRPTRIAELTGHKTMIGAAALSRDGDTLVTGGPDGSTRIWDVRTPRRPRLLTRLPDRKDQVTSVALAPDGRTLAVAGYDHRTTLWDLTSPGEPVALATPAGHTAPVQKVAFSPDGRLMATGGWDFTVRVWDVSRPRRPTAHTTLSGHTNTIWGLAFSRDGSHLISAAADGTALVTDLPGPVLAGHGGALSTLDVRADGRLAVVGGEDSTARLWDVADPHRPVPLPVLTGHTAQVKAVAFSGSGRLAASGGIDTRVHLWDVSDPRRPVRRDTLETGADVRTVVFLPGDGLLASAGGSVAEVKLWAVSGRRQRRPIGVIKQNMGSLSLAADPRGGLLAVVQDREVHLWDVRDPRRPSRTAVFTAHPNTVQKIVFDRGGHRLATAGLDGTARVWDVADPARPRALATLASHVGGVQSVAFAPDGRILATAGLDGTARLWRLRADAPPEPYAVLTGHGDRVHALVFGPGSHTLLTAGEDRTARLWDVDPHRVAARICALAHPRIGPREWTGHFPGLPYRPPCGPPP